LLLHTTSVMIPLCSILTKGEVKKASFQQPSLANVREAVCARMFD